MYRPFGARKVRVAKENEIVEARKEKARVPFILDF